MKRREFNQVVSLASAGAVMIPNKLDRLMKNKHVLKSGDTVGLITPSGPINEKRLEKTIVNLESLDLKYHHTPNIMRADGFLAGPDHIRLHEIHQMYQDKKIDAIWCIRGGYGATRYLDYLDFGLIKKNKKPIIGYSDVTALLNTIHQKTGSPCFHGPVGSSTLTDYTKGHLAPLFGLHKPHVIHLSPENLTRGKTENVYQYQTIFDGIAKGPLVGGNLSLLAAMVGTDHAVQTKNRLVFIEDVGESPYRVDRMLTQLISSGFFDKVKGIILGIFAGCERDDETSQSLYQVVNERLARLKKPCVYGFSFGHINNQCTFPIGAKAVLDTQNQAVTLLEDGY